LYHLFGSSPKSTVNSTLSRPRIQGRGSPPDCVDRRYSVAEVAERLGVSAHYEPARQLLGQCGGRVVLQQLKEGAHQKAHLKNSRDGSRRFFRLHRSVLQSTAPAQSSGRFQPGGLRASLNLKLGGVRHSRGIPVQQGCLNMTPQLSVVICTHNPREVSLHRALASLKVQSLELEHWELLLIAYAKKIPVCGRVEFGRHPVSRCIVEPEFRSTIALIPGVQECSGDVLVFVDDDNLLYANYLRNSRHIGNEYTFIGAWGASVRGEYENEPPDWSRAFLPYFGIRDVAHPASSNLIHQHDTTSCGVGLCEAMAYSHTILDSFRKIINYITIRQQLTNWFDQTHAPFPEHRRILQARERGRRRTILELDQMAAQNYKRISPEKPHLNA
jgi:hypothetical protein